MSDIENIVFEGGGMRAIAFCGALKYFEEKNMLRNIKRVIGSSAGCLYAVLIASFGSYKEAYDIIQNQDFSLFKDDSWGGYIGDAIRIINNYGFCRGDVMYEWYGKILEQLVGDKDITFGKLYVKTGIELVITGTNINRYKTVFFSHLTYPTMPVRLAMKISTAIPLYFAPVKYQNDYYVDGGLSNNYPFWYFKDTNKTLGLKLISNKEHVSHDHLVFERIDIFNLKDFVSCVINTMLFQIEEKAIGRDYWERTISINTEDIKTTDFNLTKEQIDLLIDKGYETCRMRLNKFEN